MKLAEITHLPDLYSRPITLSIAAWDPSGGAGLATDLKTFEQHKTLGMGVITAITAQTENEFYYFEPLNLDTIFKQLTPILTTYCPRYIKIGMCPHKYLNPVLDSLIKTTSPNLFIVWDPVLSSSTGFEMERLLPDEYLSIFKKISLITPNLPEMDWFEKYLKLSIEELSTLVPVLLKGGHNNAGKGTDNLWENGKMVMQFIPQTQIQTDKRGTGCAFSASLIANLAHGFDLKESIAKSKVYLEKLLSSNAGKIAYHVT